MNGKTTFWTLITLMSSVLGFLFIMLWSHAGEPKHAEAALETDVHQLAVRLERVSVELGHNQQVLSDVKSDVTDLRIEQRQSTQTILSAIRSEGE